MLAIKQNFPGVALCVAVALVATLVETVEVRLAGQRYLEALVIAILLGVALRAAWAPGPLWRPGIGFSARTLLEIAVVLLGASLSAGTVWALGPILLFGIITIVVVAIASSYAICSALGLPPRMCILIACGNSICGNSAIAAVAPVIGADSDDIASSISFTAILGVMMVLGLPLLIPLLHLSATQYGILAGLTVYAVPQVLAATVPAGLVSTQIGTLVKLMRVLMLGPVVVGFSLLAPRLPGGVRGKAAVGFFRLVPWFILGFLALSVLRSLDIVPAAAIGPLTAVTGFLTVVSMAALGLGVDVRVLATVGGRVTAAVTLSLLLLLAISIGLVHMFN